MLKMAPIGVEEFNEGDAYAKAVNATFLADLAREKRFTVVEMKFREAAKAFLSLHKEQGVGRDWRAIKFNLVARY